MLVDLLKTKVGDDRRERILTAIENNCNKMVEGGDSVYHSRKISELINLFTN